MASSKSPSALDPCFATLRCWEHDDCREHPELGLACGDGEPARPLGMDGEYLVRKRVWNGYSDETGGNRIVEGRFPSGDGIGCGEGDHYGTMRGDGHLAIRGLDPLSLDFNELCRAGRIESFVNLETEDIEAYRASVDNLQRRLVGAEAQLSTLHAELSQMRRRVELFQMTQMRRGR